MRSWTIIDVVGNQQHQ